MKGTTLRAVKKDETTTVPVERVESGVRGGEGWHLPTVFDRMERMMDEMFRGDMRGRFGAPWDRFMREVGVGGEGGIRLDMYDDGGTLVVKADLPGITKDDLNVRVVEGNLLISGERRHEEKVERKDYLRVERHTGTFNRTIPLPEGVNREGITASLKEGILEVRIPRSGGVKPVVHITVT